MSSASAVQHGQNDTKYASFEWLYIACSTHGGCFFCSLSSNQPVNRRGKKGHSPNLPFPIGFPIVKHDRFHRFPVRLEPPVGLDSVVLNRFFSKDCRLDGLCNMRRNQQPNRAAGWEQRTGHFRTKYEFDLRQASPIIIYQAPNCDTAMSEAYLRDIHEHPKR